MKTEVSEYLYVYAFNQTLVIFENKYFNSLECLERVGKCEKRLENRYAKVFQALMTQPPRDTAAPDTRCRKEEHQQSKLEHVVIVFQKNETNFYCFLIANDTNFAFQRHAQRSRFVTSTEILTNINGIGKNK